MHDYKHSGAVAPFINVSRVREQSVSDLLPSVFTGVRRSTRHSGCRSGVSVGAFAALALDWLGETASESLYTSNMTLRIPSERPVTPPLLAPLPCGMLIRGGTFWVLFS